MFGRKKSTEKNCKGGCCSNENKSLEANSVKKTSAKHRDECCSDKKSGSTKACK